MTKPKGLQLSLHISGSRHVVAAAATQVNRMRYSFTVKLKNNVSIMAMNEEGEISDMEGLGLIMVCDRY